MPHRLPNSMRGLSRHQHVERVVLRRCVSLLHLHTCGAPLLRAAPIEQQSPLDGEQPGAKRALPPKAVERLKRSDESILHQIVDLLAGTKARREPRQRLSVPGDELCRRALVATLPSFDELEIRWFPVSAQLVAWPNFSMATSRSSAHSVPLVDGLNQQLVKAAVPDALRLPPDGRGGEFSANVHLTTPRRT